MILPSNDYPRVYPPEPKRVEELPFFNPDDALSELRDWADYSATVHGDEAIAEIFLRLDKWLSAGGNKPQDWKHTANPEV